MMATPTTTNSIIRYDDLIITVAYFSIPVQIVVALVRYPRLRMMPWHLFFLTILFALFIFLCGTGHFFHCMGMNSGVVFDALNIATATVSLMTALYLLPLVPHLFDALDKTLASEVQAKRKVLTFMSFLCHEIRNPLFAITSTITFMGDDTSLSEDQKESLACIEQSANLMLRLVNDVLDISKLESGKLRLEQTTFDLIKMLDGAASSVRTDIWQKHGNSVSFEYLKNKTVPRKAIGDSVRLLQIVFNLLSNSAKFTEEGFVKFSIDIVPICTALDRNWIKEDTTKALMQKKNLEDVDQTGQTEPLSEGSIRSNHKDFALGLLEVEEGRRSYESCRFRTVVLKLEVEDSGVGISHERQKHIFEPYSQAKLSDYRKHGGTGLGLSIVTRLVEIMGGSIHVESHLREGSTFTAYLPLKVEICAEENDVETPSNNNQELALVAIPHVVEVSTVEQEGIMKNMTSIRLSNHSRTSCSCDDFQSLKPLLSHLSSSSSLDPIGPTNGTAFSPTAPETPRGSPITGGVSKFEFEHNEKVVLIVDDNAINRKLLGRMLAHFQLQYFHAENGQEAVDFVKQSRNVTHDPDSPNIGLILMDWSMPVMDGYEATRTIREMKLDVPIVALTACALEEGLQELTKAGSNEIATKPILRDELLRICNRYLMERKSNVLVAQRY